MSERNWTMRDASAKFSLISGFCHGGGGHSHRLVTVSRSVTRCFTFTFYLAVVVVVVTRLNHFSMLLFLYSVFSLHLWVPGPS
jgi:hypothetical protein